MLPKENLPSLFIRTGVAFTFLFAALSAYLYPVVYLQYFPDFILKNFPAVLLLHMFGVYEILLAVWLLTRKWPKASAIMAMLTILAITVVNLSFFSIVFRNVSIFFSCVALYFLENKPTTEKSFPTQQLQPSPHMSPIPPTPQQISPMEQKRMLNNVLTT